MLQPKIERGTLNLELCVEPGTLNFLQAAACVATTPLRPSISAST